MAERRGGERSGQGNAMSGLTGGGPSVVGVSGSMRTRDAARPRPEHLEQAERTLVIRHAPSSATTQTPLPPRRSPSPADLAAAAHHDEATEPSELN